MNISLRTRSAAAAITGGLMILGGVAVAPALAYPVGNSLAIACDATSYAPGDTATCTLSNISPAGPNDIELGDLVAQGDSVTFALASLAAQGATYSEQLVLPGTSGTYEVIGTSAGEKVKTTVQVVATGGTAATGAATTPKTGANIGIGLTAGVVALGIGGTLFAVSRRKRERA